MEEAIVHLVVESFPLVFILDMEVPGFHQLAKIANRVRNRRRASSAFDVRAAFGADAKGWKEFMKSLGQVKMGTGEDLLRRLNAGHL